MSAKSTKKNLLMPSTTTKELGKRKRKVPTDDNGDPVSVNVTKKARLTTGTSERTSASSKPTEK
jgi:hypothetical protein